MPTHANPDTMTTHARHQEVARILAKAMLRCVEQAKMATSSTSQNISTSSPNRLDVPSKTRLSVSQ